MMPGFLVEGGEGSSRAILATARTSCTITYYQPTYQGKITRLSSTVLQPPVVHYIRTCNNNEVYGEYIKWRCIACMHRNMRSQTTVRTVSYVVE